MKIESAKQDIENEFEDYSEQKRETGKELKEKQKLVDDMKNNRNPTARISVLREVPWAEIKRPLRKNDKSPDSGGSFDVADEEWKNAIEGRMGRLKFL